MVRGASLVVLADFVGEAIDPLAELFFREQGFHADSPEMARGGDGTARIVNQTGAMTNGRP